MHPHLSVSEFARINGVTRALVYLWIKTERLPARYVEGHLRIAEGTPRPERQQRGRKKIPARISA